MRPLTLISAVHDGNAVVSGEEGRVLEQRPHLVTQKKVYKETAEQLMKSFTSFVLSKLLEKETESHLYTQDVIHFKL